MKPRPSIIRMIMCGLAVGSLYTACIVVADYLHGEFHGEHVTRIIYKEAPHVHAK